MLVIGIGNEMRGDDAVGLHAVRRIRGLNLPEINAVEHSGEGSWLMEIWKNQSEVIVIDAARSESTPGTIHRYEAHRHSLPADIFALSTHMIGLAEAIELSRALGELPQTLIVYGIEGKTFEINRPLSREASFAINAVVNAIAESLSHREVFH